MKTAVEHEPLAVEAARSVSVEQSTSPVRPQVPAQPPPPVHPVHAMQRSLGNRATRRILAGNILQPKLTVGAPDDVYEKEADAVAEQVMARTSLAAAGASGPDDDDNNHRSLARKAADRESLRRNFLRGIPIRTLQQTLDNRALARLLQETLRTPAVSTLSRKCACGGDAKEECTECSKKKLALRRSSVGPQMLQVEGTAIQRDPNTSNPDSNAPVQAGQSTDPNPAPAYSAQSPEDSAPVSIAPITGIGEPENVHMEGGCDGLHLHGTTDATFDGGRFSVENQVLAKGEGCNCPQGVQCLHVTGTLVTTYSASVTIGMPPLPGGLNDCEKAKVQDFLRNVLLPHEQDHRARFKTYDGQTRNPINTTGCGQTEILSNVKAIQESENQVRKDAARALSAAIDPFQRTVDCSDCQKPPNAGAPAKPDAGAQRLPSGGDTGMEAPPIVEEVLAAPGKPLAEFARRTLEPGFGHDFSGVGRPPEGTLRTS